MHLIKDNLGGDWAPLGEYQWKFRYFRRGDNLLNEFINEATIKKENWKPIKAGMFERSFKVFEETRDKLEEFRQHIHY